MTKVTDYKGVLVLDKISAEARKQELSENERTLLWDTPVLIETTNHELTLDDTFEITSRYEWNLRLPSFLNSPIGSIS